MDSISKELWYQRGFDEGAELLISSVKPHSDEEWDFFIQGWNKGRIFYHEISDPPDGLVLSVRAISHYIKNKFFK